MEDRLSMANLFVKEKEFQLHMLVDTMNNTFQQTFSVWPLRFYIIHQGKIVVKAQPTEAFGYDFTQIKKWLLANTPN
jgi:hypothetical protein